MTIADATELFTGVAKWLALYGGVFASQYAVLWFREIFSVTIE